MSLPAVLSVADVKARYGMKDERTARRLMNEAGAFKVGGRLVVREDDLGAHERRLAAPGNPPPQITKKRSKPPRRTSKRGPSPADGPDWWRADAA